jgi:hypothetical protein
MSNERGVGSWERLLICDILFDSTDTIRKLTFLGVQK